MMMKIKTKPFVDQLAGTSGLRKKLKHFQQKNYLENFIQSIFNCLAIEKNPTLILGGDGRLGNERAGKTIVQMAQANGFKKIIVGKNFMLSTPAISHLIRHFKTGGGIILSASHNRGGENGDFGIKFNNSNGAPAGEKFMQDVFQVSQKITEYKTCKNQLPNFTKCGKHNFNGMEIEIIDSCQHYVELMKVIFNFEKIAKLFAQGFTMRFDCMHTISSLYAKAIFVDCFGVAESCLLNSEPQVNFGGQSPEPNPTNSKQLFQLASEHDICFACDADVDRNLIIGKNQFVSPGDSLAILLANANLIPFYAGNIKGVARSLPTSRAVDAVAKKLNIECYEVPTGWKFFAQLLDSGKVSICGEESFGTGSNHLREKDGLWACLMWLNILAQKKTSVKKIVKQHWQTFGRHQTQRHDFVLDAERAKNIMGRLEKQGQTFCYEEYKNQGIYIEGENWRIVFRLSGTDTENSTLRIYLEQVGQNISPADFKKLIRHYQELTNLAAPSFVV